MKARRMEIDAMAEAKDSAAASPSDSMPPEVTVVTPFYNTERYLGECIESVLAQTWRDFTYILLDNQSTDGSLAIARRYAERDPRIRLLHTERLLPQRENYNFALAQVPSSSAYCKLVAADDWLYPECLARMIEVAERDGAVMLVGAYYLRGNALAGAGLPCDRTIFSGAEVCRRQLLDGSFSFGPPTTLLYRGDLLRMRRPFFDTTALHEDTELCYDALSDAKFGFVHQVLSYVRIDEMSISGRVRDLNPQGLDKLIGLTKYGKRYLSPEEMRDALRNHERRYYRMYVRALLGATRDRFVSYHRAGHQRIGYRVRRRALFSAALHEAVDLAFNPLNTLAKLRAHWRSRS
jgi:glycosyltransferase involved in cell wall biosynthesis